MSADTARFTGVASESKLQSHLLQNQVRALEADAAQAAESRHGMLTQIFRQIYQVSQE
jgi:hypothetical protein